MTTWFRPTLSADIQAAVIADRDRHPDPVVRRKMLVLWTVHLGHSREVAAQIASVGIATAKRYLLAYRDGGLDGLTRRQPQRRPASDLATHAEAIKTSLTERPDGTDLCCLWEIVRVFVRAASGRQPFNVLGAWNAVTRQLLTVTNTTVVNTDTM